MRKILILLLVVGGVYFYKTEYKQTSKKEESTVNVSPKVDSPKYSCDGRQYCSQMTSFEEAKFFLKNCPGTKMDGDHDGIPCERQFGR